MLKLKAHSGFHDLFLKFNMSNNYLFIINTHQNITNGSIIIYFHSSQCRLIPYLHQRPICFKANSIHSSIVAILELIRGAQYLIEVIRSFGEEMWRVDVTNDSGAGTISSSGAHVHPRFFSCVVCVAQSVVFCVHVSNKGRSQWYEIINGTRSIGKPRVSPLRFLNPSAVIRYLICVYASHFFAGRPYHFWRRY
jgi:hypothetical protein